MRKPSLRFENIRPQNGGAASPRNGGCSWPGVQPLETGSPAPPPKGWRLHPFGGGNPLGLGSKGRTPGHGQAPLRGAHQPAFTLIEIVVCMAIFAIGFAAIAMMLPAGAVMQRDIEARGLGDIIGRNSLEIVKGKGVQSLTFDTLGSGLPMVTPLDSGVSVDGILAAHGPSAPLTWDMEQYQIWSRRITQF